MRKKELIAVVQESHVHALCVPGTLNDKLSRKGEGSPYFGFPEPCVHTFFQRKKRGFEIFIADGRHLEMSHRLSEKRIGYKI